MRSEAATRAISEIQNGRKECLDFLQSLKEFHPVKAGEAHPPIYRLIVTPMLYSAWERCFTLCHAIGLRLIREMLVNPQALSANARAVWLIRMPFYRSLVSRLQQQIGADEKRPRKGDFAALCDFLTELDAWTKQSLDASIATADLVMTFSNVNPDVVELNAGAIGLTASPAFASLKLGKLHDLVGSRNDIGHGARIEPPTNEHFNDLWTFTENLIGEYCDAFTSWIEKEFDNSQGSEGS